jgi:4-diphosphocytidyl-2-C-methyl-D-erythritol kinase
VLAKRSDGFHEIETLMTAISICDTVFLTEEAGGQIQLTCNWASGIEARGKRDAGNAWGDLPPVTQNLAYQAVDRLRQRAGIKLGAAIHLVKRIPSAAGMGGASSDAAAALVGANKLWRLHWSPDRLAEVALQVGSDVPFFLRSGIQGAAVCRGRGERIESMDALPRLHFVVVKPPAGLSTASVYGQCQVPADPVSVDALQSAIRRGDLRGIGQSMFNRLQIAALRLCPWIERLRAVFQRADVMGHQMSGSGTSYFGLCRSARHARQIAARLRGVLPGEVFAACSRN